MIGAKTKLFGPDSFHSICFQSGEKEFFKKFSHSVKKRKRQVVCWNFWIFFSVLESLYDVCDFPLFGK